MNITPQYYAQALFEAIHETRPEDHDKVLDNFAKILAQNGQIQLYQQIEDEYQKLEAQSKGIHQVQVTTARQIDANKEIIKELNKIIGDKVEIKRQVDERLIGGVVVRVDDTLIDASVKNTLSQLKKNLTK